MNAKRESLRATWAEGEALSIIIVNWNTRDLLAQCLQSVYLQGLTCEVLVVDNASTDSSVPMVHEQFPQVRLIENTENVGFARANNQAIRQSRGRYVLLLNSDARVVEDAVQKMLHFMDAHAEAGIVGPRLLFPDGRPQLGSGPLPTLASEVWSLLGMDKRHAGNTHRADPSQSCLETGWVDGACLMARRQMLTQVGLLDESFFMFNEEIDLCYRAHEAGWKVVHLPSARVIHLGGGSTGLTPERILRLYRGKLQYFAKHYGAVTCRLLWGAMWLATALKLLVYTLLCRLGIAQVHKDVLWRKVAGGLAKVRV